LTIATSLLIIAFATGVYLQLLDGIFTDMFQNVETLIEGMG
jgi:hypothetical protein